ncbi:MAG: radical SAM protein [Sulfuricellaceae bacterium]|nr:radical SAM protein [Sulfuricellaceae bacterium]
MLLTSYDHSRAAAGLTYVYPVVSRRAGGVSVGINLNPNNACNWRCVYCQVPDLVRGSAPAVDMGRLEDELRGLLQDILQGDFMARRVAPEARRLSDIALSGNGEPTSAQEFDEVVDLLGKVMAEFDLTGKIKLVLITNGSLIRRQAVQQGLRRMAALNGEVWFKLDSATEAGRRRINGTRMAMARVRENAALAASLCPTWLQTCMFAWDGQAPSEAEQQAYLACVTELRRQPAPLRGVLLYSLARPSMQAEAPHLSALEPDWMESFAAKIERLGVPVKLSL